MIDDIIEFISKIPLMLEFVVGTIVYLIFSNVLGEVVADVSSATICELSGITYWFACFYLTNPLLGFISTIVAVIGIATLFKTKFF